MPPGSSSGGKCPTGQSGQRSSADAELDSFSNYRVRHTPIQHRGGTYASTAILAMEVVIGRIPSSFATSSQRRFASPEYSAGAIASSCTSERIAPLREDVGNVPPHFCKSFVQ